MAQRMKRLATQYGVQDSTGTAAQFEPEPATSSFRHRCPRHGTNGIYTHNSSSSLFLADDEDSSAGSPDEANGEFANHFICPTILSQ